MIIPLFYPLSSKTPCYPNTPGPAIAEHRSMAKGDSANHSVATISCHAGTHIDAPLHFCPEGASVVDLLAPENSYCPTYCWDIHREPNQRITRNDLDSIDHSACRDAEAILIRTGLCRIRASSPDDYARKNPAIDPDVATFLRSAYPSLKLIGIDAISVANHLHKMEGRSCHREFLCRDPPVLILEDADLGDDRLGWGPFTLTLFPVLLDHIEATPVIALADIPDRRRPVVNH